MSTEQQAGEQRTSLPEQRSAIAQRAAQLGRTVGQWFEDAGVSGATAEGRPGFMALVAHCEANRRPAGDGLVIALNDSRLGRFDDPEEATFWRVAMRRAGWVVRFVEGDDMADGTGRSVVRLIGAAQASEYRANLKRTAARSARATATLGRWQNEAPLAYRRLATQADGATRILEPGKRKAPDEVVTLTPGPADEVAVVRFLFEQYAAGGLSIGALVNRAAERFPDRRWSKPSLRAVLSNPAYAGVVRWCRRPHDRGERARRWTRDPSEWVVTEGAHPALVSRELFDAVQRRLAGNKKATRATTGGYPLSGLIRCGQCGSTFAGGGGKKGPPSDPDRFRFYRDSGAVGFDPKCAPPVMTLLKRWLEPAVIDAVARVVSHPTVATAIREALTEALTVAAAGEADARQLLERELARMQQQRARLVDAVTDGTLTNAEAASRLATLRARIASLEAERERTRFAERRLTVADSEVERLAQMALDFPATARRLTGAALRECLAPWLADAVVDKAKRTLTLTIRRVPAIGAGAMLLGVLPARDSP